MLDHVGLNVADLGAAERYFDELAPMVGFEKLTGNEARVIYRPRDGRPGTFLCLYPAAVPASYDRFAGGLQHLAFTVGGRSIVREVHAWALARAATILDPPQLFPQYSPSYFATFWLDPNGFKLEAVCHDDRD